MRSVLASALASAGKDIVRPLSKGLSELNIDSTVNALPFVNPNPEKTNTQSKSRERDGEEVVEKNKLDTIVPYVGYHYLLPEPKKARDIWNQWFGLEEFTGKPIPGGVVGINLVSAALAGYLIGALTRRRLR